MNVMLDTNILISAALFTAGRVAHFVEKLLLEHTVSVCSFSMLEVKRVVARKFPNRQGDVETFVLSRGIFIFPTPENIRMDELPKLRDNDDYPILRSAVDAGVDFLLSGDFDFDDVQINHPKIMTIAAFMEHANL